MDPTLSVQTQIRRNAEDVQSFLADLNKWEKNAKQKDGVLKEKYQQIGRKNYEEGTLSSMSGKGALFKDTFLLYSLFMT